MRRLRGAIIFLLALAPLAAQAQTCPVTQSTPAFTAGGSVFGRIAAQWNSYFGAKVDANNGVLCNPTFLNTTFPFPFPRWDNTDPSKLFWNGPSTQYRVPERLFVGGGVADSGSQAPFPQSDWLSQMTSPAGEISAFGTGIYATSYFLTVPDTVTGTPSNIAAPTQAIMAGNQTLNSVSTGPITYSTPRTIECSMVNNVTAAPSGGGPKVPGWCHYAVAARLTANAGATYVGEFEVANFVAAVTGWTPESTSAGGTIGLEIGSGAGLSATDQYPTTVAMYIAANPTQFGAGLLMLEGAIGAYGPSASPLPASAGPGATITAMGLMYNQEIQFYHSGLQHRLFGDTSDHFNILSGSGILNISSQINSTAANAVLNAPTSFVAGLSVNGVAGVNFNGAGFVPGLDNTYTLGGSSLKWSAAYLKTAVIDALPTSAGGGGLAVCVDTDGVLYKKASCP
jgi:hypothetical protein